MTYSSPGAVEQPLSRTLKEYWFLFDNPGDDVINAAGDTVFLNWIDNAPNFPHVQGGPNPFDLTDPTTPIVKQDGNYTFNIGFNISAPANDVSAFWGAGLIIDSLGLDREPGWKRAYCPGSTGGLFDEVNYSRWLAAGMKVRAFIFTDGTAAPRNSYLTGDVSWTPT